MGCRRLWHLKGHPRPKTNDPYHEIFAVSPALWRRRMDTTAWPPPPAWGKYARAKKPNRLLWLVRGVLSGARRGLSWPTNGVIDYIQIKNGEVKRGLNGLTPAELPFKN